VLYSPEDEQVFAYTRELDEEKIMVLMNFSRNEVTATLPECFSDKDHTAKFVVGNVSREEQPRLSSKVVLKPYEGQVWALTP
jgi:oligo-1,6-glucosidase